MSLKSEHFSLQAFDMCLVWGHLNSLREFCHTSHPTHVIFEYSYQPIGKLIFLNLHMLLYLSPVTATKFETGSNSTWWMGELKTFSKVKFCPLCASPNRLSEFCLTAATTRLSGEMEIFSILSKGLLKEKSSWGTWQWVGC